MSQSKREQVVSHLRYIRQELREMHQGVMEDGLLPEAGEVRGVMAQMEALLELLEGRAPARRTVKPEALPAWVSGSRADHILDNWVVLTASSMANWTLQISAPPPCPSPIRLVC
jgi:hypothetical protein